ncbi:hypothetical protein [Nannocystis pusilla]|uniref:Lipoprotein n=1 Tax=Nannocystis pusilla TaxID=889268 RepID=A0ABS7TL37_9BACT|nr:hypothetical protein [Nannocystis pusilla]MBZ5708909.1 hypothetical protein [Nannocystis pusilla]
MVVRSSATARRLFLSALLAPGLGCDDWRDGLDAWYDGENLTYYNSPSLVACGGTRAHVDGFVPFVTGELGLSPPAGIAYVWLDTDDFADSTCDPEIASGCAHGRRAQSTSPTHLHELVHAVTWAHGMNRLPFLTEGIAVAYEGPLGWPPVGEELSDPRPVMTVPGSEVPYGTAGAFVQFLLWRHGPAPLVDWAQQTAAGDDLARIAALFADAYGLDLDDEVEAFRSTWSCGDDPLPVRPYACAAPTIPWTTPETWTHTQSMDCSRDDVVGGFSPLYAWPSASAVTLDVDHPGPYTLVVESDGDFTVRLAPCFGCPWDGQQVVLRERGAESLELAPGRYYLQIQANSDEAPEVTVSLQ